LRVAELLINLLNPMLPHANLGIDENRTSVSLQNRSKLVCEILIRTGVRIADKYLRHNFSEGKWPKSSITIDPRREAFQFHDRMKNPL
jgi:hypothetical protein